METYKTVEMKVTQKQNANGVPFLHEDNRLEAIQMQQMYEKANTSGRAKELIQLQKLVDTSPKVRKLTELQGKVDEKYFQKEPIQRKITNNEGTEELTLDEVLTIGEANGIRETSALIAMESDPRYFTINEALSNALAFQHENEMRLTSGYDYDSEGLSDEDIDSGAAIEMERKSGAKKPGVALDSEDAVKRLAKSKRRMLKGTATPEDKKPVVVDTVGGGNLYEFQPNGMRKDMGAYRAQSTEEGGVERVGGAEKYVVLARKLDTAVETLGMTYSEANELIVLALQGKDVSADFGVYASLFGEFIAVLLTDMARGSGARDLIITMLSDNSSFYSRLREGGTYLPASTGGTKYIREFTDERK